MQDPAYHGAYGGRSLLALLLLPAQDWSMRQGEHASVQHFVLLMHKGATLQRSSLIFGF